MIPLDHATRARSQFVRRCVVKERVPLLYSGKTFISQTHLVNQQTTVARNRNNHALRASPIFC
jgi:hypothetical protein